MPAVSGRALSFGAVAEAYERFRPGYPQELVDLVLAYAEQPVRTALEIGAGTGKATRMFAQRGISITATEPDGAMLAELRKHVPDDVRIVRTAELQLSEWFSDVEQSVIERRFTVSAQDYVGQLSTISAYLQLPAAQRTEVFDEILRVLPETVEIAADITVHLARRSCPLMPGHHPVLA
jgi:SAM-dependent methyltransferase